MSFGRAHVGGEVIRVISDFNKGIGESYQQVLKLLQRCVRCLQEKQTRKIARPSTISVQEVICISFSSILPVQAHIIQDQGNLCAVAIATLDFRAFHTPNFQDNEGKGDCNLYHSNTTVDIQNAAPLSNASPGPHV